MIHLYDDTFRCLVETIKSVSQYLYFFTKQTNGLEPIFRLTDLYHQYLRIYQKNMYRNMYRINVGHYLDNFISSSARCLT